MKRLSLCLLMALMLCWGCGDPPNSVMEIVLPDKDMPPAEEPAVTMADVKTTPAEAVTAAEEQPPVTMETEEEEEPPPIVTELPDLGLVGEMEAILASEGEVHSPIPNAVYEQLWGNWTKAGSAAPRKFYTKFIDADGIAIVGSDNVEDRMLQAARHIVLIMTSKLPGLREALAPTNRFRLVIFNGIEGTTADLPDLAGNPQYAGLCGPPFCAAGMRPPEHRPGGRIVVHEMAHAIHSAFIDYPHLFPRFNERLISAYERQLEDVPNAKDYVDYTDPNEYWAHFVASRWFDGMFEPLTLERNPNYEHLEIFRERWDDVVNMADEVFPRFSITQMMIDRYWDR